MRVIVCDTGPIFHLGEANLLDLLQIAGKVSIPKRVDIEMNALWRSWGENKPKWLLIEPLSSDETVEANSLFLSGLLDCGEAEAIVLAKRLKPEWFLTDDIEARIFVNALGMEVHGSLGVVLWAAAAGHLSYMKSKQALHRLSRTSLWMSREVMTEAHKALKTMFEKR